MSRPDREKVDDDGVRIRGEHWDRYDPPVDASPLPGLWVGHSIGTDPENIEIQEFGKDGLYPQDVFVYREEIPKLIEALAERCYPRHQDEIRDLVEDAVERAPVAE